MKVRKFKPGDRVQKRGKGQVMIVLKYCLKQQPLIGTFLSDHDVECVWYENGQRKTSVFDQRTLTKISNSSGLFNNQNKSIKQIWTKHG